MSKKDKEEKFKDLWKQFLKEGINKDPKDMEKEMIKETKAQLLKVIEQIETADDFRKFLIQSVKVLINDYQSLIDLLNATKDNNEN